MLFAQKPCHSSWLFQRLRGGEAEIDDAAAGRGNRQLDDRPRGRCSCSMPARGQEPPQSHLDPGRRTDRRAPDHTTSPRAATEIGAHDEKPVHPLRLGAEQLCPVPFGKTANTQCAEPPTKSMLPSRIS